MYQLAQDDSGHWYVIPTERAHEFEMLCEHDDVEEFPAWAVRIGGAYSLVTFDSYRIGG